MAGETTQAAGAPKATRTVKVSRAVGLPGSTVVVAGKSYVVKDDRTIDLDAATSDDELKAAKIAE